MLKKVSSTVSRTRPPPASFYERLSSVLMFLFLCLTILAPLICSVIALGGRSATYLVRTYDCSYSAAEANISWRGAGDWKLIPHLGACITSSLDCGVNPDSGKSCSYTNCLSFYGPKSKWEEIDFESYSQGYPTAFMADAKLWARSGELGMAATILLGILFVVFALSGLSKRMKLVSEHESAFRVAIVLAAYLVPASLLCWVTSISMIQGTTQLDPNAWMSSFLHQCNINIDTEDGFRLVLFTIAAEGLFSVALLGWILARVILGKSVVPWSTASDDSDNNGVGRGNKATTAYATV